MSKLLFISVLDTVLTNTHAQLHGYMAKGKQEYGYRRMSNNKTGKECVAKQKYNSKSRDVGYKSGKITSERNDRKS